MPAFSGRHLGWMNSVTAQQSVANLARLSSTQSSFWIAHQGEHNVTSLNIFKLSFISKR
jgi:hypothetical protein